jgi:hypothetical protein
MNQNFVREIETLLSEVPAEQWQDPQIRGVCYDILPWHKMSCVTVQTADDDPGDLGGWKYYFSAESDGSLIQHEYELYKRTSESDRLVYHRLLMEAAEALLSVDFDPYVPGVTTIHGIDQTTFSVGLNKTFLLQVYHADGAFRFNYCEHVFARQLEST